MTAPRLEDASLARVGRRGHAAIETAHGQTRGRAGLVLRLHAAGHSGYGEATPLPGYSPDTLEDCRDILEALTVSDIPIDEHGVAALLEQIPDRLPAAAFAAETALMDLRARLEGRSVAELLAGRGAGPARRCALAGGDWHAAARAALSRQITALKCKLGVAPIESELRVLAELRGAFPQLELRVDANRGLAAADLTPVLSELARIGVAWIEEPCAGTALSRLESSPVPIALDETLADHALHPLARDLVGAGRVAALVLKPAVLGGMRRCLQLAGDLGAPGIASHLMDGPIALAATAELACALGGTTAHGVDHHPGLDGWPAVSIPQLERVDIHPTVGGLGVRL